MKKFTDKMAVMFVIKTSALVLLAIALLSYSLASRAATLTDNYVNDDGDRICVYEKHFHEVTVNVGFNGHCSFNVPDDEL